MEKKEIAIIKVDIPVFFPGKFLGGRVEKLVLVLNPQEELWKVFGWEPYLYKKKPCKKIFLEGNDTIAVATEIHRLDAETYKYIYRGFLCEETHNEALALWMKHKVVRGEYD